MLPCVQPYCNCKISPDVSAKRQDHLTRFKTKRVKLGLWHNQTYDVGLQRLMMYSTLGDIPVSFHWRRSWLAKLRRSGYLCSFKRWTRKICYWDHKNSNIRPDLSAISFTPWKTRSLQQTRLLQHTTSPQQIRTRSSTGFAQTNCHPQFIYKSKILLTLEGGPDEFPRNVKFVSLQFIPHCNTLQHTAIHSHHEVINWVKTTWESKTMQYLCS